METNKLRRMVHNTLDSAWGRSDNKPTHEQADYVLDLCDDIYADNIKEISNFFKEREQVFIKALGVKTFNDACTNLPNQPKSYTEWAINKGFKNGV